MERGHRYPKDLLRVISVGFLVCVALLAFARPGEAASVSLNVPYLSQLLPGQSTSNNCGETCCVMMEAFYRNTTPSSNRIIAVDDWLFQRFGYSTHNYYGSTTNVADMRAILQEMMGFPNAQYYGGQTAEDIRAFLDAGKPVIVQVNKIYGGSYVPHAIIAKGYDDTYIYFNDPFVSNGASAKYTYSALNSGIMIEGHYIAVAEGKSGTSQPPSLIAPDNGKPFPIKKSITFSWANNGASMYHVQFISPSGSNTDINVTNQTFCQFTPDSEGTWRWKVIAHTNSGDTGSWSETRNFTAYSGETPTTPTESYSVNYYNNASYSGTVASSESGLSSINRDWGTTNSPSGCTPNLFSAVFTGNIGFETGWYRFSYTVDDSVKLWLSRGSFSDCICDNNGLKTSPQSGSRYYKITSAGTYTVRVEYVKCHAGTGRVQVNWTPVSTPMFNVYFNSQGGSSVPTQTLVCDSKVTQPTDPVRAGYAFGGWYTDSACNTVWDFNTGVGGDRTLYAKWSIKSYTVRFDSQSGSAVGSITVNYNAKLSKPSDPTRSGFTFGGWYGESQCINAWDFSSDTVLCSMTLYARWNSSAKPDLAPCEIIYDTNFAIGKQIHFDAGVVNCGNAASNSFAVKWEVNGAQMDYGTFSGLLAQTAVFTGNTQFYWTPSASGSYTIKFTVDCDNTISESNESNNSASVMVVVPAPVAKPDLVPITITYDTNVAIGKEIRFDSGIQNKGDAASKSFNIKWEVNGERLGYWGCDGVPAKSTDVDDWFYWTPSAAGSYTVKYTVDCDSQVSESNENNNSTSVTVVVPQTSSSMPKWYDAFASTLPSLYPFDSSDGFFLADCDYNGTPEVYCFVRKSNGYVYLRRFIYKNQNVSQQDASQSLGRAGGEYAMAMSEKKAGGYVWTFDACMLQTYNNINMDSRFDIEPHTDKKGRLYVVQNFRQVEYTNGARRYYVKDKQKSFASYEKAGQAYASKLGDDIFFSCYNGNGYSPATATRGTFASVFKNVCECYLTTIRSKYSIQKVMLSKRSIKLRIKKSYRLKASAAPSYVPDQTLSWSSGNPLVATVSQSGVVKAVGHGRTLIYATISGKSTYCTVTVP